VTRPVRLVVGGALAVMAVVATALALTHWRDARAAAALERRLTVPPGPGAFDPATLDGLPDPARRYLAAAIAPGASLARSVRMEMEGRFRLGSEWVPLRATERLSGRGFVWAATLEKGGTPLRVWDTLGPEGGKARVWLMGLVPVLRADGPDVTRSDAGRLAAEMIWLPTALLPGTGVTWEAVDTETIRARIEVAGEVLMLHLRVDGSGDLTALWLERWGDLGRSGDFAPLTFGGDVAESAGFGGLRVPTRITAGWSYGTDAYSPFFDVTITAADFSGAPE
jgi:hypothetical protein